MSICRYFGFLTKTTIIVYYTAFQGLFPIFRVNWTIEFDNCPPGQLLPRTIAPRQFPSQQFPRRIIVTRTVNHRTISTYENFPQIVAPGQFRPRIIDLLGQMTPGRLLPRTNPIRVIAPRRLCCLEIFYCLSLTVFFLLS